MGSGRVPQSPTMQTWLFFAGLTLIVLSLLWPWLGKLPFGRLPGDLVIERENFSFYFPITTSLVLSLVLTLLLWWWRR